MATATCVCPLRPAQSRAATQTGFVTPCQRCANRALPIHVLLRRRRRCRPSRSELPHGIARPAVRMVAQRLQHGFLWPRGALAGGPARLGRRVSLPLAHTAASGVLASRRYDPGARLIRAWLPELSGLPAELAHQPWAASAERLCLGDCPAAGTAAPAEGVAGQAGEAAVGGDEDSGMHYYPTPVVDPATQIAKGPKGRRQ